MSFYRSLRTGRCARRCGPCIARCRGWSTPRASMQCRRTLESATAIAVSYSGSYITETDEKKINRIRQVTTDGEISWSPGYRQSVTAKTMPTVTATSRDGYAKDTSWAHRPPSPPPRWHAVHRRTWGTFGSGRCQRTSLHLTLRNFYGCLSGWSELYIFDINGTHQYTVSLGHWRLPVQSSATATIMTLPLWPTVTATPLDLEWTRPYSPSGVSR